MDGPGPANKSICRHGSGGDDGDRISSLRQGLIEHILTFLPLREVVKTSILSSTWRHKWVNCPSLVFDDHFWTPFPVVQTSAQYYAAYGVVPNTIDRLTANVFRVLCFHKGPLREFSLCIPRLSSYPALVDQVMLYLYGKPIERLWITIDGYRLPSRLFSFRQLKKLQLYGCMFNSSRISLEEFSMLTCLDLRWVKFPEVAQVSLVIRCPLLSALTLLDCGSAVKHLEILIEAPVLSMLYFVGSVSSLWVEEAPLLKDVTIRQSGSFVDHSKSNGLSSFMKLCGGCPTIERLSIATGLFKDLTPKQIAEMSPFPKLMMLRQLRLDEVCLSCVRDVWCCLFLIEHSPDLQELIIATTIRAIPKVDHKLRIIQLMCESWKYKPNKLEKVELNQLQGVRTEMCFIRWLLAALPVLDRMEIKFSANSLLSDQFRTLKELNGFQRLSNKAQVINNVHLAAAS